MRGRIRTRRPAYEEQHKFRPTSRGTNVYVGSTKSWKSQSALVEESFRGKAAYPEKMLLRKILSGEKFFGLEALNYLKIESNDDRMARNLMLVFLARSDLVSLGFIAKRERYPLADRLKAVELLSDNFDAICTVRNYLDYEPKTDDNQKVSELVYEKWKLLRAQGHLVARELF